MPEARGRLGEDLAVRFLQARRCRIEARNYHSRYGEIDVIASNSRYLIFLEVKLRRQGALVPPLQAITPAKQRKIRLTAQQYLQQHPTQLQPRFDAMGITLAQDGRVLRYVYLKNAFTG